MGFCVVYGTINKNYFKLIPAIYKIIKENKIDLVFSTGSSDSYACAFLRLFCKNTLFVRQKHNSYFPKSFYSKLVYKHGYDRLICVSQHIYDFFLNLGVKKEKLFLYPPSIEIAKIDATICKFKDEFNLQNKLIIGFYSNISIQKGAFDFAKAVLPLLEKFPNLVVVMVGGCGKFEKNEMAKISNSSDKFLLTGFRNDGINALKAFDICVFPSHSEGFSIALLEQMACKKPVVVYDIEPMNKIIKHKFSGLHAKFGDISELTKMIEMFINDKNLAEFCGKNAYEFAKNYDISVAKKKMIEFIESLEMTKK